MDEMYHVYDPQQSGHKVLNDAMLFELMMFVLEYINMLVNLTTYK